ncbi:uncharacterized protein EV422DRAFT_75911 [Fimicolochytrium jonesii]|uniref:uncharacterized protein n=1 Tax=Fimicolochytrium jonesii TaxID=1396493 RepID=UPI0022FF41E3|nr:uncharacterized protein EV422DRAFT_75911 [Fimicolochytrium jonesii]KAI8820558.1 hypothetical protein EV422DRAFT_75911 [Fimicolochytrium jonesii]
MLPCSFGLTSSCLMLKSWGHYTRRKNKMALGTDFSMAFKKVTASALAATLVLFVILVALWRVVEAPTPQLTYASQDRFWICWGTEKKQIGFITCLMIITGTILLTACKLAYETIKVGWPVPALEDRLLLVNAANMGITGILSAGILLPNMMNGIAQFALRTAVTFVVAAAMTASFLGYKVWLLYGLGGEIEDAMEAKIKAIALKSQKSQSIYQKIKYLPVKPDAALVWRAVQISVVQNYIDFTDIDTKEGRFYVIDSVSVEADTTDNSLLLQLPGGERLRVQMESQRALEEWVRKLDLARGRGATSKARSMASRAESPLKTAALAPASEEELDV